MNPESDGFAEVGWKIGKVAVVSNMLFSGRIKQWEGNTCECLQWRRAQLTTKSEGRKVCRKWVAAGTITLLLWELLLFTCVWNYLDFYSLEQARRPLPLSRLIWQTELEGCRVWCGFVQQNPGASVRLCACVSLLIMLWGRMEMLTDGRISEFYTAGGMRESCTIIGQKEWQGLCGPKLLYWLLLFPLNSFGWYHFCQASVNSSVK